MIKIGVKPAGIQSAVATVSMTKIAVRLKLIVRDRVKAHIRLRIGANPSKLPGYYPLTDTPILSNLVELLAPALQGLFIALTAHHFESWKQIV